MSASVFYVRAGRAGSAASLLRSPELQALQERKVAMVGLGCLGATSALECARAGLSELRLVDDDFVDPGTISRWSLGLCESGRPKVHALSDFIRRNYPRTEVLPHVHRFGTVRFPGSRASSDRDVLEEVLSGVDAIYDASAELGVQHLLSDWARDSGIPYLCVTGSYGGWGGLVVCIDPERTSGCWFCYRQSLFDETIPYPPEDPTGEIQAQGCGDRTFTGAGFDMATIALCGVRTLAAALCRGDAGGYPALDWDVTRLAFRTAEGLPIAPEFTTFRVAQHERCTCAPR